MGLVNLNPSNVAVNIAEDFRNAESTVAVSATSTVSVVLAANTSRACYSIHNAGPSTVYLREGSVVSSALYSRLIPSGFLYEQDFAGGRYTGVISVITASGTASLMVSEGALVP